MEIRNKENDLCDVCSGSGMTINTECSDFYGQPCLRGHPIDRERMKELGI